MASLRVANLSKSYGAVHAVRGVSLAFEPSRIHAVVGENGAGKSTLLKIAAGIARADAGDVIVDERRLAPETASEAIRRGVGMVQQHFALIGVFSALENIVLGFEPMRGLGRVDFAKARVRASEILRDLGVDLPLDAKVETLGVGDRQRLEIARALFRDARVLILDEPTAVLTPAEADAIYTTLRRLADSGRTVIVVTHKLDEVRDHADFVSVMRKGELVWTRALDRGAAMDPQMREIEAAIMGESGGEALARARGQVGARRARALKVEGARFGRALRGVSFELREGDVCGVAGVEGNGQRELVRALAGLSPLDGGSIEACGPIAVVHEDRHAEGLVLDADLRENVLLGELARFAKLGWLDRRAIEKAANDRVDHAGVVPPDLDAHARSLSGGNQQKIVVARAIAQRDAKVLVLAHPTRGVDQGAARAIHKAILDAASRGVAVLVLSADLNELRTLCDRILVIARGEIVAELPPSSSDRDIGAAMLGTAQQQRPA